MGSKFLQTLMVQPLGVQIVVHSDSSHLLDEIRRRFEMSDSYERVSGPVELTVTKHDDGYRVQIEGREEKLRLAQCWPRFDDLIQLIVRRERSDLVFIHGACIELQDSALVLFGSSTAGKTTLGLALHQRGYGLLAEDLTPVSIEERVVFPFRTSLNLRTNTAKLAGEHGWVFTPNKSPSSSPAKAVPLRWLIFINPKTKSRTVRVSDAEIEEWERFHRVAGVPSRIDRSPQSLIMPIRTEADFDCPPALEPIRQSEVARQLLRHSHLPSGMPTFTVLAALTSLVRGTHNKRLIPGHLLQTLDLLCALTLPRHSVALNSHGE